MRIVSCKNLLKKRAGWKGISSWKERKKGSSSAISLLVSTYIMFLLVFGAWP